MGTAADSEHTSATDGAAGLGAVGGSESDAGTATSSSDDRSDFPSAGAAGPTVTPASAGLVFDDPLDRPSSDDVDRGWGDLPSGSADDDFARFLSEKPPHHL